MYSITITITCNHKNQRLHITFRLLKTCYRLHVITITDYNYNSLVADSLFILSLFVLISVVYCFMLSFHIHISKPSSIDSERLCSMIVAFRFLFLVSLSKTFSCFHWPHCACIFFFFCRTCVVSTQVRYRRAVTHPFVRLSTIDL